MEIHCLFLSLLFVLPHLTGAAPVGICYGRVADNLPSATRVADLVKSNKISSVRLFKADPETLQAFSGSGVSLMIGVPNEALPFLAGGPVDAALRWLQSSIFNHIAGTQIRYLAVGNEIFLKDPFYAPYLVPAMENLHRALQFLNLENQIKLSTAHAASILSNSYPPSAGAFDPNIRSVMLPVLQFLNASKSPLMVNVYPFFSYTSDPEHVSLDFALFRGKNREIDQNLTYENMFDAAVDAFVYAMEGEGFGGIPVVVTETGWPTAGTPAATAGNAFSYNGSVVRRAVENVGTPRRPGVGVEVFLFDLFDEDGKAGEEYEKHFGIFGPDGVKAYDLSFN